MNDLISRKALIERLNEQIDGVLANRDVYTDADDVVDSILSIIDIIENQPPAQQWIPVEERLPERQDSQNSFLEMYLVQSKRGVIHMGFRDEEGIWRTIHGNRVYQDVAWMPLPEAYKGE